MMEDDERGVSAAENDPAIAAESAFVTGDIAVAAALYEQLVKEYPENPRFLFNLGSCLSALGRHAEAIDAYKAALLLNPLDADILYYLGLSFLDCDMPEVAEKFLSYCLAVEPGYLRAHCQLAHAACRLGKTEQAVASYRLALNSESDRDIAGHMLSALCGRTTERAPDRYVRSLFDNYAGSFEKSLTGIGYDIPRQLRKLLDHRLERHRRFQNVVDLGCGTGLSGSAFSDLADKIIGVDLSAGMLEEASAKGIYHHLRQKDLIAYLLESSEIFDLFLLTDVLVYLGNLVPLFSAMAERAAPDALFLFSVERGGEMTGYQLQATGRYAHSSQYIEEVATQNGLSVLVRQDTGIRKQDEEWIAGEIYILSLP